MALSTRKKWQSERRSLIKRGKWKLEDLINSLHAGLYFMIFCRLLIFFKTNFFEKFFQEYHQSAK